jgi:hypothetical protein
VLVGPASAHAPKQIAPEIVAQIKADSTSLMFLPSVVAIHWLAARGLTPTKAEFCETHQTSRYQMGSPRTLDRAIGRTQKKGFHRIRRAEPRPALATGNTTLAERHAPCSN